MSVPTIIINDKVQFIGVPTREKAEAAVHGWRKQRSLDWTGFRVCNLQESLQKAWHVFWMPSSVEAKGRVKYWLSRDTK
jgi:hypothetical protein